MSFLVSALLALAAVGTVLGAAFYFGWITPGGGGTATASGTPRPSVSFVPASHSPSVAPSVEPSPSVAPSPSAFAPGGTYTVKPGDSLSLIGDKVGVPWTLIAEANGIQPPGYIVQVGQVLIIPIPPTFDPNGDTYVVQSGDNIYSIADKLGVDPTDLADFNYIADWNSIQIGQVLYIPRAGWTPRPTPSAE